MRKPKVMISKCLNSEKCRYDGQGFDDKVIRSIREYIDIETVCPEVEIGLATPRDPIRIEKHENDLKLIQHNSNIDYSNEMYEFAEEFIKKVDDLDGFILKSKSPSCGIKDVKIYPKGQKCSISKNGNGFFAQKLIEKNFNIPIENEGRLKNYILREEFLTKIFTLNRLKDCNDIKKFHENNKMLLKSYDLNSVEVLENLINNEKTHDLYINKVKEILNNKRSKTNKVDIIKDVFNRYKNKLNKEELSYNDELVDLYINEKIPFSSLLVAIKIYALRFNDAELIKQTFFNPYPQKLVNIMDSGKGREL